MTTYTPKTRQPQAPALAGALPKDLADALTTAERVLGERDKLHGTLQRTHVRIPELLARKMTVQAELGRAEIEGKDTSAIREQRLTVESERLSAVAQREGSIGALLSQEPELTAARDTLNTARQPYIAGIVNAFSERYAAAVRQLQMLWQESDALAAALRSDVPAPLPVKVSGGPKFTPMGIGCPEFDPIKVERDLGPDASPPPIDATAARIGATLDRLDGAFNFAAGIRSALRMQSQLSMRTTSRGFDPSPSAVYIVAESFVSHFDNLSFEPGTLVDVSLLGLVTLQRLTSTKKLRLVQGETRAAA
jgi:hypothetical protein